MFTRKIPPGNCQHTWFLIVLVNDEFGKGYDGVRNQICGYNGAESTFSYMCNLITDKKDRNFRMEYFPDLQMPQADKNIPGIQELDLFDKYTEAPVMNRLILIIMKTHPWLSFVIKIIQLYQVVMMMDYSTIWLL